MRHIITSILFLIVSSSCFATPILRGIFAVDQMQSAGNPLGANQYKAVDAASNVSRAVADGFTGVIVDVYGDPSNAEQVFTQLDVDSRKGIPVLDLSPKFQSGATPDVMIATASGCAASYITFAASHPSAYKNDGKLVMLVFGTHQLTADQWQSALGPYIPKVTFIGDLSGPGPWSSTYSFWTGDSGIGKTFMPCYGNTAVPKQCFVYNNSTWTSLWQSAIAEKAPAVIVVTFDDFFDKSSIMIPDGCEAVTVKQIATYKKSMRYQ